MLATPSSSRPHRHNAATKDLLCNIPETYDTWRELAVRHPELYCLGLFAFPQMRLSAYESVLRLLPLSEALRQELTYVKATKHTKNTLKHTQHAKSTLKNRKHISKRIYTHEDEVDMAEARNSADAIDKKRANESSKAAWRFYWDEDPSVSNDAIDRKRDGQDERANKAAGARDIEKLLPILLSAAFGKIILC